MNGNGVPYASARLYTFDSIATTTPKTAYSDNGLTTPYGAYVQADANGVFPQMFATSGTAYFAVLKDASGNTVQQYQFLTALGADDASSLSKDFSANGRWQVRGSGGIVQVESGDPAGDDIGGSARYGGWAGTQGVTLTIDYATTTFTGTTNFTGAVTQNGVALIDLGTAIALALAL